MSVEWFYSKKLPQFDTNVTVHTADRHLLSGCAKRTFMQKSQVTGHGVNSNIQTRKSSDLFHKSLLFLV